MLLKGLSCELYRSINLFHGFYCWRSLIALKGFERCRGRFHDNPGANDNMHKRARCRLGIQVKLPRISSRDFFKFPSHSPKLPVSYLGDPRKFVVQNFFEWNTDYLNSVSRIRSGEQWSKFWMHNAIEISPTSKMEAGSCFILNYTLSYISLSLVGIA